MATRNQFEMKSYKGAFTYRKSSQLCDMPFTEFGDQKKISKRMY